MSSSSSGHNINVRSEYYPLDPNYFDYYNACHHAALWLVGYDPGSYPKKGMNLCEDMAIYMNQYYDITNAFFKLDSIVLNHSFRLFNKFMKNLSYTNTIKPIMIQRNQPEKILDYGRFRNEKIFGYYLPDTNIYTYNNSSEIDLEGQVNLLTKQFVSILNNNIYLDCYQKLDMTINRSHKWWDAISNNFNKNYYIAKLRYENINAKDHIANMKYEEGLSRYCHNLRVRVNLLTEKFLDNIIETKKLASKKDLNITKDVAAEQTESLNDEIVRIDTNIPSIETVIVNNDDNKNLLSPPKKKSHRK